MNGATILPKLDFRDRWHYALAEVLFVLCAVVGFFALNSLRHTLLISVSALGGKSHHIRAIQGLYWLFSWIPLVAYSLWGEHLFRTAVTAARVRRARAAQPPTVSLTPPENALMRFFWRRDLDILVRRFIPYFAIPVALYLVSLLVGAWAFSWA